MSTFLGEKQSKQIRSEEDLEGYFQAFAKRREAIRVGIEVEFFGVNRETGKSLPYEGSPGIETILKELSRQFKYEPVLEDGRVIALKRGSLVISLEPGGQVELSAPPATNVFQIENQVDKFLKELRVMRKTFPGIEWLSVGMTPFSSLDEISWVPKKRYQIMAEHFKTRGKDSYEMMKRTASIQVNFDYLSEEHAMASLRTALGITSIVTAIFANSAISDGKPNGFLSRRLDIWNHMDPDRSGLAVQFIEEGLGFSDYMDYILKIPMFFIVRKGQWIPMGHMNFREFIRKGYQGLKPTISDFELQLSTAFPEVRLKQYLEIRGTDCQKPSLIPAVAAFWKGILYDNETREKAWKLVQSLTKEERLKLHQEVPALGLKAKLRGQSVFELAEELVDLSCASLAKQQPANEKQDECRYLKRIREEILKPGKSPAETLLVQWHQGPEKNRLRLIETMSIG